MNDEYNKQEPNEENIDPVNTANDANDSPSDTASSEPVSAVESTNDDSTANSESANSNSNTSAEKEATHCYSYSAAAHYSTVNNLKPKRKKLPTWAVVLICAIGALYLIISCVLLGTFFKFSKANNIPILPDGNGGYTQQEYQTEIQEHLKQSESPSSDGAKTSGNALTVKQISQKVKKSVVGVTCQSSASFSSSSVGSGIIMSSDGYIITNNHVIENATTIQVTLDNGKSYDARLIGSDSRTDLAVIKINAPNLSVAEFGDSDKLEQGDPAIAIGNPAGLQLQNTVTFGIISAINRDIIVEDREMTLIQTDASINPGNSGGPLVNEFGQVVGINTVKVGISYYEGLGFAIPINTAKPIIDELISHGYIKGRPSIGISGTAISERDAAYFGLPSGMYIEYVHPNSDAFKKGIRRGDVITKINGKKIASTAEIKEVRDGLKAGDSITLTVYRNSEEVEIKVALMDEAVLSNTQGTVN